MAADPTLFDSPKGDPNLFNSQGDPELFDSPSKGIVGAAKTVGKFAITPLSKTLTGKSLHQRAVEASEPTFIPPNNPVEYWKAFSKSALGGIAGETADVVTTPLSLVPIPFAKSGGKLIGKIPIKGTTLKEVATKVPIRQIFNEDVAAIVSYQNALANLAARTSASRSPLTFIKNLNNPVAKVQKAIKDAGPIRAVQENLFRAERAKRAAALEKIGKGTRGEAGFIKKLSSLKGELPKAQFQGIRGKITQADSDGLFDMIERSSSLNTFEKVAAGNGLKKLFGEVGGGVPTPSEISLLSKVFPKGFIKTIVDKKPELSKTGQMVSEIVNIPRSLMTSYDMSGPLRQAIFLIGRPRQFVPAFKKMFRYFGSEKAYQGLLKDIQARKNFPLMRQANLSITDLGKSLTKREEAFMSSYADRVPGVRASGRAFSGFLNKLRADVFDDFVKVAEQQRIPLGDKVLKDMGGLINAMTGRGPLGPMLERASVTLNAAFFSPRLMSSRLTLMNPFYYTQLDPFVRKEALRSLFSFAGIASTILTLASFAGAKVGTDPRSADFGKIRTGNTRYDILGGFQQYMRLATQLVTGEHINSTTGVKTTVGEGFKPLTRKQILGRFIEAKEAPLLSFISTLLEGKGFAGEELDVTEEVVRRFIPMVAQDAYELANESGPASSLMAIPAFFGVGLQTYSPTPSEVVYSARAALRQAKKLDKQGDFQKSRNLLENNKELIELAGKLSNAQDALNKWERRSNEIDASKKISERRRQQLKKEIDFNIQDIESRMEKIVEQHKQEKARLQ